MLGKVIVKRNPTFLKRSGDGMAPATITAVGKEKTRFFWNPRRCWFLVIIRNAGGYKNVGFRYDHRILYAIGLPAWFVLMRVFRCTRSTQPTRAIRSVFVGWVERQWGTDAEICKGLEYRGSWEML